MHQFRFRLDKVLKLREHVEKEAEQDWGRAKAYWQEQHLLLQKMQEERLDVLKFGYQQMDRELRKAMYQYLSVVDKRIHSQTVVLDRAQQAEAQARQAWITAKQERESLAKLKEKQFELYRQEQLRQEQYMLDDLARNSAVLQQ